MNPIQIQTSWGTIKLTLEGGNVTGCALPLLNNTPRTPFSLDHFQTLEKLIEHFPKIGKPDGTKFQRAVWREMKKIKKGKTKTYGEIAAAIGRPKAVRAVGSACGANPIPLWIPCHRVVAKNGLGGFGSGLPWKEMLLKEEGWIKGVLE